MKTSLFLTTLLGLASLAMAEGPSNIALRRPWASLPASPNHPATNNGQEYRKLTDGVRATGPLWEAKAATAGWQAGRAPLQITLDLGKRQPISGVAVGSGAGVALDSKRIYFWPGLIDIFVSDDKQSWVHLGELISMSDSENAPLPSFSGDYHYRNISTHRLKAAGRYVQLVFSARAEVFIDEVEVFEGNESFLNAKLEGPVVANADLPEFVKRKDATLYVAQRRYRLDLAEIEAQLSGIEAEKAAPIRATIEKLRAEVEEMKESPKDKRASIPVGDLGRRILEQQAAVWRAQGKPSVTLWQQGLWDHLYWMTAPPEPQTPQLQITQIRGEHRSTSFNLTNASEQARTFLIEVEGLTEEKDSENLEVRATEWNEQVDRTATAFALLPAKRVKGGYEVSVPAGMTRQVWLTLLGSGTPGEVKGKVAVSAPAAGKDDAVRFEMPLTVTLHALDFPEQQSLDFYAWEYLTNLTVTRYGVGSWNNKAAIEMLKRYRLNSNWAWRSVMPEGTFNAKGEYEKPEDRPDTAAFKEWVRIWPDSKRYYIYLGATQHEGDGRIGPVSHKKDPELFFKSVTSWLKFWEAEVRSAGIDPKNISFLIIDEPGLSEADPYGHDELISIWVEAFHRSGTAFTQWLDPVYREPWKANQGNLDAMDELCVKYAHLINNGKEYVDYYRARGAKQQLRLYECYPAVGGFDPYSYYRLQAWMAWDMNANGVGLWAATDSGRAASFGSWNNGLNPLHYSPLFFDSNTSEVYAGKAIEGVREGVYDYQYLVMLRDAIAEAKRAGQSPEAIAAAERVLVEAPKRVLWEHQALAEPKWLPSTKIDRSIADQVRLDVLAALESLQ